MSNFGSERVSRAAILGGIASAGVAALSAGTAEVFRQRRTRRSRHDGWTPMRFDRGLPDPVPTDRGRLVHASDGVELFVEEVGPLEAPLTVFFAHGYTLRHEVWLYQCYALRERFGDDIRMVFYDHRSHGRSSMSPRGNSTLWQLARDLHHVIDECAPTGPIVLVGHSMGGMTIQRLAEQAPGLFRKSSIDDPEPRVKAVALVNTSAGEMHDVAVMGYRVIKFGGPIVGRVLRAGARLPNLVESGRYFGKDLAAVLTERFAFGSPHADRAVMKFCTDLIAQTRIEIVNEFFDTLIAHDGRVGLLNLVDTDVLIIAADHDDLTPMSHSETMKMALPRARLRVFEQSGHMTMLEFPEEVDQELISLIAPALENAQRVAVRKQRQRRLPPRAAAADRPAGRKGTT